MRKDSFDVEDGTQDGTSRPWMSFDLHSLSFESGRSLSSWVADPTFVSIEDLRFSVKLQHGQLDILRGVTAHVESGSVLAVMGGSGAGKTTFLNAVTLLTHGGIRSGQVLLNNQTLDQRVFTESCAYVEQEDLLWPAFTVRETLDIAAALYLGRESDARRRERVDSLLDETGLSTCQNVMVGDAMIIKGISGGQRRRLSVTIELLKRPVLLLLDEPTSGLDSAAAEALMQLLSYLSRRNNLATICTIHQPSSYIFRQFDQLLLLAKGQSCYFGAARDALAYFEALGFPSDAGVNPAEFLIRLTNTDFCPEEQVTRLCNTWRSRVMPFHRTRAASSFPPSRPPGAGASFGAQVRLLFVRSCLGNVRNPAAFFGRLVISSLSVAFVSLAYFGVRQRSQKQVLDRVYVNMWIQQLPAFLCVGAVPNFSREYLCFRKEVKNGLYNPSSHFIADALVNIPFWFVLSLISIAPGFLILNLNQQNFLKIWLLISCFVGWTDTMAQLCGTLFRNTTMATMMFILQTLVNMIFNGILLVQTDDVIWILRWLFYVVPSRYSFRSGVLLEFTGVSFSGFDRCVDLSIPPEERARMSCWGAEGLDVLDALKSRLLPVITTDNTLMQDMCIILGELICLKLIHLLSLRRQAS